MVKDGKKVAIVAGLAAVVTGAVLLLKKKKPPAPPEPPEPGVANLYGVIIDRKTGSPLDGVKISINGITTHTNANGIYLIENLIPGNYLMTLEKEGYGPLSDTVEIIEGNNEINVEMDFIPPIASTLYGRVTDRETGEGIPGVFIRVIYKKDTLYADVYTTTTDSLGNYLLENMVANVNVYIAFGRSFYEKVEIDSFYLAMGSNELNVPMTYIGPPEMPAAYVASDFPPIVSSGEPFWAGQIVWLKEMPDFNYSIRLSTGRAAAPIHKRIDIQSAKFWTAQLWDKLSARGRTLTGIRMDYGDGQYTHYGIGVESYSQDIAMTKPGTYPIYSQCKIREYMSPGWHDYGWAWKDVVVGTVEVII